MAKRTNLQTIINNEISKGNIFVRDNGNFVSEEHLNREILDDFKRGITDGSIPVSVSFEQYKGEQLATMRKAEDVLAHVSKLFEAPGAEMSDSEC